MSICQLCGDRNRKHLTVDGEVLCTKCAKGKAQYEREHGGKTWEEVNRRVSK